jgi:TolA-binding protein
VAWYYLKVFFGLVCFLTLLSATVQRRRVVQPNNTRRQNEEHERLLNGQEHPLEEEEEQARRRATHLAEQLRVQQGIELARRQRIEDECRRLQQKQEQQRRQQEQHLAEQLRARQEAAELARRQRKEDECLKQEQKELGNTLIEEIDFFIRTRSRFDSRQPLLFEVYMHVIAADSDVAEAFQSLREHYSMCKNLCTNCAPRRCTKPVARPGVQGRM